MRKLLLVEDDEDIRYVTTLSLEVGGWQVVAVGSGAEGVAIALRDTPDIILLDVSMPGMDGPATLRELKQHRSLFSTPVILLTANALVSDQLHFEDLGVAGVLLKPYNPLTLPVQIAAILGWGASNVKLA